MARRHRQVVALPQGLELTPPAEIVLAVTPLKTLRRINGAIQAFFKTRNIFLTLIKATTLQSPQVLEIAISLLAVQFGKSLRFLLNEG